MSSNYDQLIKKFKTNVPLYNQCREVIQEYVSQGIVECVENVTTDHCNPIFPRSTTKLRVVFDVWYTVSVLLKLRQHRVAFMADIEKAFWQISFRGGGINIFLD